MMSIVLGLIVFLAVIAAVIGFGGVLHWGRQREIGLLPYIFYPIIFSVMLAKMTSGRDFSLMPTSESGIAAHESTPAYVFVIARFTTLFILVAVSERIINRVLHYGRNPKVPMGLLLCFIFFFLTTVVLAAFLGTHPSISHEYMYLFLGGSAALLFSEAEGDVAIRNVRNAMLVCLVVSACFLIVAPQMVIRTGYLDGVVPGLTVRYAGLTSHSNTMGGLTVVYLLCLSSRPYKGWLNRFAWIIGLITLVIAQSKTSWITFSLSTLSLSYFRYSDVLKKYFFDFRRPFFLVTTLSLVMIMFTVLISLVLFSSSGNFLNAFLMSQAGADLMTMTGRAQIWEVAVLEWQRNPLFGYGLTIWNDAHRAKIGISAAVTAHSQFYQTLSSSGIVGVIGLVIYVLTLLFYALKTVRVSQGLTLALFLMVMFRSMSEVPLTMVGYYGPDELTHLIILMVIASHFSGLQTNAANLKTPPAHALL